MINARKSSAAILGVLAMSYVIHGISRVHDDGRGKGKGKTHIVLTM